MLGRGFGAAGRVVGSAVHSFSRTAGGFREGEDATGTGAARPPPLPFHRLHKARHSPSWPSPASPFARIF